MIKVFKMKCGLILGALLLLTQNGYGQSDDLTIHAYIKGLGNTPCSFTLVDGFNQMGRIELKPINGKLTIKLKKQVQPRAANIQFYLPVQQEASSTNTQKTSAINLFVYKSNLSITGNIDSLNAAKVSGDQINQDHTTLSTILNTDRGEKELGKELDKLDYIKDSTAFYNLLNTKGVALQSAKDRLKKKFIEAHPNSFISIIELGSLDHRYTADDFTQTYNRLGAEFKNTKEALTIKQRVDRLKVTAKGKPAFDFSRKDQYGNPVKLSDYKGKLVLLDFWGSWCKFCRDGHPHLKELYKNYKSKGLEIIGVALEHGKTLEESKATWKAAIKSDGIDWVHVLNNDGVEDMDIIKAYGINGYPTKILLDKDGKVLMRITSSFNEDIDQLIIKLLGSPSKM